ncbi:alpha/beta hydrolase [Phycicoccus sp. CSK15P-2]|uniref:alpha/beta hydrolase n=1 Tax=Phycicoccus sp. CSK15P-2 TaxID=2807627 RepID=UPI0019513D0A|nr:alpha/beta hydrolase [Phycicoccus sp. CSK15P-2]MBM6404169.1 alpha/beta hydrolase [Phycicoccus sp. CSK15P-2]
MSTGARPGRPEPVHGPATVVVMVVTIALGLAAVAVSTGGQSALGLTGSRLAGMSPWLLALAAATAAVAWLLVRARRSAVRLTLAVLASGAVLAHGVVTTQLLAVGWRVGVVVNPWSVAQRGAPSDAPDARVRYLTDAGEDLSVAVWEPAGPGAPVLFYVHGGGWVGGDPEHRAVQLRWFAEQGWLVVGVQYSHSDARRHLWDVVPAQVGCALVWAAEHAVDHGGDPSRIVVVGDSAGGNLAVNLAYRSARGDAPSACPGRVPRVVAVAGLYPVLDPVGFHDVGGPLGPSARRMASAYLGGTPEEVPERYRDVDSTTYVSAEAPPTLLLVPGSDRLVPASDAEAFADRARQAGVDVTEARFPYLDHAFDRDALPDALYRRVTDQWLREHVR